MLATIAIAAAAQGAIIAQVEQQAFDRQYQAASPTEQAKMLDARRHRQLLAAIENKPTPRPCNSGFASGLIWGMILS